ncbi:MAG: geranylgeranylglyceryl/heptaprenylglyceryl phosphate synthase [Flavobacteriales bacterium]
MKLLDYITNHSNARHAGMAILIDPDKIAQEHVMKERIERWEAFGVSLFLVGGSVLHSTNFHDAVKMVKRLSRLPVVLFPGNAMQIDSNADGILLLSLISGRNPDLLIGQHVLAAPALAASKLEIIPTGYMLIDGGRSTSASYISQTHPIPHDKPALAAITALAGEQLGLKCIYLDAGSGAEKSVTPEMVRAVREAVQIPVMVGGGLRSKQHIQALQDAGADLVVVGTFLEENPENISQLQDAFMNSKSKD